MLLLSGSSLQALVQKVTIFSALMTIKAKKKSPDCSLLSLTCIKFEKRFEYPRKTTEFWVYATTYKGLSCYFMKQIYLASQKTLIQSVHFLIPLSIPLLYIVNEGKNIDNRGVPVRGLGGGRARWGSQKDIIWAWLNWTLFLCD